MEKEICAFFRLSQEDSYYNSYNSIKQCYDDIKQRYEKIRQTELEAKLFNQSDFANLFQDSIKKEKKKLEDAQKKYDRFKKDSFKAMCTYWVDFMYKTKLDGFEWDALAYCFRHHLRDNSSYDEDLDSISLPSIEFTNLTNTINALVEETGEEINRFILANCLFKYFPYLEKKEFRSRLPKIMQDLKVVLYTLKATMMVFEEFHDNDLYNSNNDAKFQTTGYIKDLLLQLECCAVLVEAQIKQSQDSPSQMFNMIEKILSFVYKKEQVNWLKRDKVLLSNLEKKNYGKETADRILTLGQGIKNIRQKEPANEVGPNAPLPWYMLEEGSLWRAHSYLEKLSTLDAKQEENESKKFKSVRPWILTAYLLEKYMIGYEKQKIESSKNKNREEWLLYFLYQRPCHNQDVHLLPTQTEMCLIIFILFYVAEATLRKETLNKQCIKYAQTYLIKDRFDFVLKHLDALTKQVNDTAIIQNHMYTVIFLLYYYIPDTDQVFTQPIDVDSRIILDNMGIPDKLLQYFKTEGTAQLTARKPLIINEKLETFIDKLTYLLNSAATLQERQGLIYSLLHQAPDDQWILHTFLLQFMLFNVKESDQKYPLPTLLNNFLQLSTLRGNIHSVVQTTRLIPKKEDKHFEKMLDQVEALHEKYYKNLLDKCNQPISKSIEEYPWDLSLLDMLSLLVFSTDSNSNSNSDSDSDSDSDSKESNDFQNGMEIINNFFRSNRQNLSNQLYIVLKESKNWIEQPPRSVFAAQTKSRRFFMVYVITCLVDVVTKHSDKSLTYFMQSFANISNFYDPYDNEEVADWLDEIEYEVDDWLKKTKTEEEDGVVSITLYKKLVIHYDVLEKLEKDINELKEDIGSLNAMIEDKEDEEVSESLGIMKKKLEDLEKCREAFLLAKIKKNTSKNAKKAKLVGYKPSSQQKELNLGGFDVNNFIKKMRQVISPHHGFCNTPLFIKHSLRKTNYYPFTELESQFLREVLRLKFREYIHLDEKDGIYYFQSVPKKMTIQKNLVSQKVSQKWKKVKNPLYYRNALSILKYYSQAPFSKKEEFVLIKLFLSLMSKMSRGLSETLDKKTLKAVLGYIHKLNRDKSPEDFKFGSIDKEVSSATNSDLFHGSYEFSNLCNVDNVCDQIEKACKIHHQPNIISYD